MSTPGDRLPYRLDFVRPMQPPDLEFTASDINGDGRPEYLASFSHPVPNCMWKSAVIAYDSPLTGHALFQYNGPDAWAHQWFVDYLDCIGSPADDIVMVRTHGDTAFLEIVAYDSLSSSTDTTFVVAAIGKNLDPAGYFHDLTITPLTTIDVNGDGYKDLIYSRSVKPDSAFERAVIAYDLKNQKQIWLFPVADAVGRPAFSTVRLASGATVFVFTTNASGNAYTSSNDMTSKNGYVVCVDINGKERWRHTACEAFWGAPLLVMDVNGDGVSEAVVGFHHQDEPTSHSISAKCFDIESGNLLTSSEQFPGTGIDLKAFVDSTSGTRSILVYVSNDNEPYLLRLGTDLRAISRVGGVAIFTVADLNHDKHPEIVALSGTNRYAVLDSNFELLAVAVPNENAANIDTSGLAGFTAVRDGNAYSLLSITKRPLLEYWYARYQWHLAILIALVVVSFGFWSFRWFRRLYLAAAGLPGLDKVDSLVLVLDRKGHVTYVNDHALVKHLLSPQNRHQRSYREILSKAAAPVSRQIDKSFEQPLKSLQDQVEIDVDGATANLLVATYPRIDRNNKFLGKVVLIENITSRADWQRKVVLGEAAQRWLHKLKGNLATARLYLENLEEDRRLDPTAREFVLTDYLPAVKNQIRETAETAGKILRFSSIRKPELMSCDVNALVDRAVEPYLANPKENLTVARMQQDHLPSIDVDPGQIRELIDNLLSNAVFAMKAGGKLTIRTGLADVLPLGSSRRMIEIVVEDTGIGIDASDLERIFQPGFSKAGGTGVGLALVKEIVENHGGQIDVVSRPQEGTRFTVKLPVNGDSDR